MVKIVTWNVNSIKSRLNNFVDYVGEHAPDILLLQELKCTNEAFPYAEIEDCGYNVAVHGQKTYNGVAIISKYPIEDISTTLPGDPEDIEARYIEGVISYQDKALRVASVYVPNGKDPSSEKFTYKLNFFDRLHNHLRELLELEEIAIIGGDYNVAPAPIDVYDHKSLDGTLCYHPKERAKFRCLENLGWTDAYRASNDNICNFSWWDYRGNSWQQNKGMRIDHLLLSPEAADKIEKSDIDHQTRAKEKPSDHAPVFVELAV